MFLAAVVAALCLAGCGGGGSNSTPQAPGLMFWLNSAQTAVGGEMTWNAAGYYTYRYGPVEFHSTANKIDVYEMQYEPDGTKWPRIIHLSVVDGTARFSPLRNGWIKVVQIKGEIKDAPVYLYTPDTDSPCGNCSFK